MTNSLRARVISNTLCANLLMVDSQYKWLKNFYLVSNMTSIVIQKKIFFCKQSWPKPNHSNYHRVPNALETALTHFAKNDAKIIYLQKSSLQYIIGLWERWLSFWDDVLFQPQSSQFVFYHAFSLGEIWPLLVNPQVLLNNFLVYLWTQDYNPTRKPKTSLDL